MMHYYPVWRAELLPLYELKGMRTLSVLPVTGSIHVVKGPDMPVESLPQRWTE